MATDGLKFDSVDPAKMLILMALPAESQGLIEKWADQHGASLVFTGMGMIKATQKTTQAILEIKPDFILNLGTAGSRQFAVGTVVECIEIVRRDHPVRFLNKKLVLSGISILPKTNCGTADNIDSSDAAGNYGVVDMEAYAIASVSKEFKIACAVIKCVTDSSEQNVKEMWETNTQAAAKALHQFLMTAKRPPVKN